MNNRIQILDTFADFLDFWANARYSSLDEQVRLWQTSYMNRYPELLDMQIESYQAEKIDWRDIAARIFPLFPANLGIMRRARNNILAGCEAICTRALEFLGADFEINLVIYVGIGCGAGWATSYGSKPAILLGLENIAEEKWHTKAKLEGLISHETGHLTQGVWRTEKKISWEETGPLFQLYSEGFAQKCEHLITGGRKWHMAPDKRWFSWCEQNKAWLAGEFLNRVNAGSPVRDFFGSWYDVRGRKQTGYYLGYAFISELEKAFSLKEIAVLEKNKVEESAVEFLKSVSVEQ